MWVRYIDWIIEDLNFTINMTYKCNMSCDYCPLYNKDISISSENLDSYINFFLDNREELYKYCKNIVIVFFGWEPLLEYDKVIEFIERTKFLKMKYVIYTNWLLLNKIDLINLKRIIQTWRKIVFYTSLDWGEKTSLENRFKNKKVYEKVVENIWLLQKEELEFSVSKVFFEKDWNELFENLKFLYWLWLVKLDFLPVAFCFEWWFSKKDFKEIIRWFELFISFMKKKGYSELNIMEFFWLPDDFEWFKQLYNVDYGMFWDIDWTIYGILDGYKSFSTYKTFKSDELKRIKFSKITETEKLMDRIKNYKDFEEEMYNIWLEWLKREYLNDYNTHRFLSLYFVKRLLMFKFKPQDLL